MAILIKVIAMGLRYLADIKNLTKIVPLQIKFYGQQINLIFLLHTIDLIYTKLISLPPHSLLRVSLQFWKIDCQNSFDRINFYVDGQIIFTDIFYLQNGNNICGSTSLDEVITINKQIKHNFPTALIVISFQSMTIQMQEFWGINKFQLFITKCPIGCVFCEDQAILPQQCNQFILASSSLTAITQGDFNIEGWQITNQQKDKSLCGNIPILCKYENITQQEFFQNMLKNQFK